MNLWRLEWLRMVRTHRWLILFGLYAFFGVLGPYTARYFNEIISRFGGGDVVFQAPDPQPVDGIVQFLSNASQVGLLAVVVVATGALAVDARPEVAAFLRTRTTRPRTVLLPRFTVTAAAAALALVTGTAIAWALTVPLIGSLPTGRMLLGTALGVLYLAFAVAVVAAVAGWARSQAATVLGALGALLVLPILGLVDALAAWLPSELLGAVSALVAGAEPQDYVRPTLVTVAAIAALLWLAVTGFARREL